MKFLGTIILATAGLIDFLIQAYIFVVFGSIIISWVNPDPYNPIVRFLYSATQPVYSRVRRFLPDILFRSGLDFTPMIVLVLLWFLRAVVVQTLNDWGMDFRLTI